MRQVTVIKIATVRSIATVSVPDEWTDDDTELELYVTAGRGEEWEKLSEFNQSFVVTHGLAEVSNT